MERWLKTNQPQGIDKSRSGCKTEIHMVAEDDRAYEGNETRQLVLELGLIPVVPPKSSSLNSWKVRSRLYTKRNERTNASSAD